MEIVDIYDEERQKTGRTMERHAPPAPGDCRTVVHVCIFNRKGELLIQRRSAEKRAYPLRWDVSAAGGVDTGETPRQAAEREVREELGVELSLSRTRPILTVNFPGGFDDFFAVEADILPETLSLQTEEVCDARYVTVEEAEAMVADKRFCPYPAGFLTVLAALRHGKGFVDE